MGKGLQRIAALTASATAAVMAVGAIDVGALVGVSAPTVTTTVPQVTVPSTTVTVPSTPVAPQTTVTTPTVTTPPPPPKVTTPKVTTPKVTTPKVTTPKVTAPAGGTGSGSGAPQKVVSDVAGSVGGSGSGGGGSTTDASSPTKAVTGLVATGTSALDSTGGGSSAGTAGSGTAALQALGFFGGTSGPGGSAGAGGGSAAGGGGKSVFAAGGRGLPPTLTGAQAKQLRAALSLLERCMGAIAPLDRQVLAMRAGAGGTPPLSRGQVAARLGVPARQVRLSERRGLSGLRTAAAESGCAGAAGGPFSVAGIGISPLLAFATAEPGGAILASPGGASGGGYIAARAAGPEAESPLARLADGGESGPAWLIVLVTVLFSVAVAALMRELRTSLGAPRY